MYPKQACWYWQGSHLLIAEVPTPKSTLESLPNLPLGDGLEVRGLENRIDDRCEFFLFGV